MDGSVAIAHLKLRNFCNESVIFGGGNDFLIGHSFNLRKSVNVLTSPVFFFWTKVGAPHGKSEFFSKTSVSVNQFVSFFIVLSDN